MKTISIDGVGIVHDSDKKVWTVTMERDGVVIEATGDSEGVSVYQSRIIGSKGMIENKIAWITAKKREADRENQEFFATKMVEIQGKVPGDIQNELYSLLWPLIEPFYP